MSSKRLELTWVGKETRPKLEPRILLPDDSRSHAAPLQPGTMWDEAYWHLKESGEWDGNGPGPAYDNLLIHGDNLLALKALEQQYTGCVKCIYIDPPYNTGQAFEHYDDSLEHSVWLTLLRDRLELLRKLLRPDGVIFVQLDDTEFAYCKVLLDELFGRKNFINQIAVKTKNTAGASGGGEDKRLKKNVEFLLIYAKDSESDGGFQKFNDVNEEEDLFELIEEMESEGKSWKYTSILVDDGELIETRVIPDGSGMPITVERRKGIQRSTVRQMTRGSDGQTTEQVYFKFYEQIFSDTNAQTSIRQRIIDEFESLSDDECLIASYVPRSGRDKGKTVRHHYISPTIRRVIWLRDSSTKKSNKIVKMEKLGTYWSGFNWNNVTKEGGVALPFGKKPEALLQTILELSTNPGDLVLDSFAGSGTTGATAHKMGRRWILVELGNQCFTHIVPRMQRVIDGDDTGGITKTAFWKSGGGFRFATLAPSMLKEDKFGNQVINPEYNAEMLAEAMCKHLGFTYAPSREHYWMHGQSSESDFLFVTTQTITQELMAALSADVGDERTLLVCCSAWRGKPDHFPNLTLKKIPPVVLSKCEWGQDDYSSFVANLKRIDPDSIPGTLFDQDNLNTEASL